MIKAIIFDNYGVLVGLLYMMIREQYPDVYVDFEKLYEASDLGYMNNEERNRRMEKLLDDVGLNGKEVLHDERNIGILNRELFDLVKKLHEKYKTGVLSNTCDGFWESYEGIDLREYFDDVVLSYQVGLLKPDPRVFKLAVERLGVLPEECVFVDDVEMNVRAAEDCGMKGILYEWGMDFEAVLDNLVAKI